MNEPRLTFTTDVRRSDYCEGCQKEGSSQVSGVKRHRSLPLDTWLIKITMEGRDDCAWHVFCADCLESANKEENITVIHDGDIFKRANVGMMFMEPEDKPKINHDNYPDDVNYQVEEDRLLKEEKMIYGLLIDPFEQSVTRVGLSDNETLKDAKFFMKLNGPIDIVTLTDDTMVIVDDEFLLKNNNRYFKLSEYHQPLAGRAIVVGYGEEGETTSFSFNEDTWDSYIETIEWMPEDHVEEPYMEFIPWD